MLLLPGLGCNGMSAGFTESDCGNDVTLLLQWHPVTRVNPLPCVSV
jgi:hypothetical protein